MTDEFEVFQPRPEEINDWSGQQLDPKIRQSIGLGNIVRIQIQATSPDGAPATPSDPVDAWHGDTPYLKIVEVDGDRLTGEVDDPYRSGHSWMKNGRMIEFDRWAVTEIPLQWDGNEKLAEQAEFTGLGRQVTGSIDPYDRVDRSEDLDG
ncbi:hypothetical protein OG984_10450 [Nocardioides sp. NBC_00368]|uniref:hypothetical protein n=1 Tax=Nocardioides sp. NBC_00368 TaxID=2976000 RepID=UPI002E213E10